MDCRTFHNLHVGYVDDVLPAIEMEAMHRHRRECAACARHDALERRALMLVRSLPRIEPSPDFASRLQARIHAGPAVSMAPGLSPSRATMVAAACVTLMLGTAFTARTMLAPGAPPMHRPVVAALPEPEPAPSLAQEALVASISTGMPMMIPVSLLADQAPVQFANAEFQLTSFSR